WIARRPEDGALRADHERCRTRKRLELVIDHLIATEDPDPDPIAGLPSFDRNPEAPVVVWFGWGSHAIDDDLDYLRVARRRRDEACQRHGLRCQGYVEGIATDGLPLPLSLVAVHLREKSYGLS